jgi:predicted transcriptional regulator
LSGTCGREIEARREKAKALVEGGMSQRQAAEALGVSVGTVNSDLAFSNRTENVQELNAGDRDERREAAIIANLLIGCFRPVSGHIETSGARRRSSPTC